ncbi:bacteriochlorophyll 4-vinyl reductase [Methylocystis echinoides]|uniref:bacteriochlorophyll 4-vinyl reductase n=1 Tax=Methylocystis echinoides TaxID=29468 RepID=UPI003440750F
MNIAFIEAANKPAVIGPNAITRMAEALSAAGDDSLCEEIFASAGLTKYLAEPPTQMVLETDVAKLHRVAIDRLGESRAADVSRDAGRRTGDYLLTHRIPPMAQRVLKRMPRALAARILVAAIARHAWTFAGGGDFGYAFSTTLTLRLKGSPICKELHTREPACAYFAATFERVFGAMLGPGVRVVETACEATGGPACVFEVRW